MSKNDASRRNGLLADMDSLLLGSSDDLVLTSSSVRSKTLVRIERGKEALSRAEKTHSLVIVAKMRSERYIIIN
jgi:hypothetical protein